MGTLGVMGRVLEERKHPEMGGGGGCGRNGRVLGVLWGS